MLTVKSLFISTKKAGGNVSVAGVESFCFCLFDQIVFDLDEKFSGTQWWNNFNSLGALDTWRSRDLGSAECASLTTRILRNSPLQSVTGVWNLSKKKNLQIVSCCENDPHSKKFLSRKIQMSFFFFFLSAWWEQEKVT